MKELSSLFLPLLFLLFSNSLRAFLANAFLAHHSLAELQASTIGEGYVIVLQSFCVRMATDAQVFVSQACSTNSPRQAGVFVWQMIWVSLASIFVTLPISFCMQHYLFADDPVNSAAKNYFMIMMYGNFLFPLAAAITAFYTGRAKKRVIVFAGTLKLILQLVFSYALIFGVPPHIPALGLYGAAFGNLLSEGLFALFFFFCFIQKKYREKFGTALFKPRLDALLRCLRIGAMNGLTSIAITLNWALITYVVSRRESDFLTVVACGSSLNFLIGFFDLGLGNSISILAARYMGTHQEKSLNYLIVSSVFLSALFLLLISPIYIFYPDWILSYFLPHYPAQYSQELTQMLRLSCLSIWVFELCGIIDRIMRCLLTAAGDTIFVFVTFSSILLFVSFTPIYFAVHYYQCSPNYFWPIIALSIFLRNIPLIYRFRQKRWLKTSLLPSMNGGY